MEIGIEDEIVDMSMVPPSSRSNEFGQNKEFMSKDAYLRNRNRCSEIDIEVEDLSINQNGPLPIFLKVL
ncbi:hypothetical protein TSUD_128090 [Trifolium subterraneum]|nr:hypothetical protein TSUD_128090 [Trifolium subterraneum]